MARCMVVDVGLLEYVAAWELQKRLHSLVAGGMLPNVLLLLEHPHVYTMGRRGSTADILAPRDVLAQQEVGIHHVDRGGEVTYHGPGQLVGYPIVDLRRWGGGPLKYVRSLEDVLVATLAEFGIVAGGGEKPTGVWLGESKIAAIGVKVSRGVTTHGFALNVAPDLSYFDHIVPCGMREVHITSMMSQRPEITDARSVIPVLARRFGQVFGWNVDWSELEDL